MEIVLSQGKSTRVDDADGWVSRWKWSYMAGRHTGYAYRKSPRKYGRRSVMMHRVLLGLQDSKTGENLTRGPRRIEVDHVNRDGLDNRRSNLRAVRRALNVMNTGGYGRGRSGRRGVHWSKRHGKWMARLKVKGKVRYLGIFDDPDEAKQVYDKAARELVSSLA